MQDFLANDFGTNAINSAGMVVEKHQQALLFLIMQLFTPLQKGHEVLSVWLGMKKSH